MRPKTYLLKRDIIEDLSQDRFPATLQTWQHSFLQLSPTGTHFGYVYQGHPLLSRHVGEETYRLHPGMYFCLPGEGRIDGETSSGIVFTCLNFDGMFNLGGPIESTGRLAYINGGTSSLLVPPLILGDPCLNAMYFPANTDQTLHTHPSYRLGIVVAGSGSFETPETEIAVEAGTGFLIPADCMHKFRTLQSPLAIVVLHPDSDTGFTHKDNPMLKRTMVEGVSAAELPQIQTKFLDYEGVDESSRFQSFIS
jgi:AraC-like ligand binding domain